MSQPLSSPLGPSLSIFDPSQDDPGGSTLGELFEELHLPQLEELERTSTTIREFRTHLKRWQEFWSSRPALEHADGVSACSLGEPPAERITRQDLLDFRRWEVLAKLSNRSRNKHVGSLQAILKTAHEHGRVSGLVKVAPLPEQKAAELHYLAYEEVDELYKACDVAEWPQGLPHPPAVYWRAGLVLFFNYGCRTQELLAYEPDHRPLTWGQISWDERTLNPIGHARCPHGWLTYVPQKQKRLKPQPLFLPLNELTAAHLRSLVPRKPAADQPVFCWPRCNRSLYAQWRAIVAAARIRPRGPAAQDYELRHLRKTCATWHNYYKRGIAPLVLGHAARDGKSAVTDTHYDNAEQALLQAVLELPQPTAFRAIFDREQLRLF